jgi:hypothetical protein
MDNGQWLMGNPELAVGHLPLTIEWDGEAPSQARPEAGLRNRVDPHPRVHLPVAGAATEVLAAANLLNVDFVAHFLS